MTDASAWKTILTLGTGVTLAAGIAYAFLNQNSKSAPTTKNKKVKGVDRKQPSTARSAGKASAGKHSDDEDTDIDGSKFRGYKQTSSGKTTTYFNRELSDKDKALLGDSTPKRIDTGAPAASSSPVLLSSTTASPAAAASAWNTAGTWEEKDVTQWASGRLRELMSTIRCASDSSTHELSISAVKAVDGDASIAVARGKRKNIYDFTVEFDWKLSSLGVDLATGSTSVGDISAAYEHEIVCRCNGQAGMTTSLKNVVQELALTKTSRLKTEVNLVLKQFLKEFETKTM